MVATWRSGRPSGTLGCGQGVVNMHLPERWAFLQFADGPPGAAPLRRDPHWTLRTVVAAVYDAQAAHAAARNGTFAGAAAALERYAAAHLLDGTCTAVPELLLSADRRCWWATVRALDAPAGDLGSGLAQSGRGAEPAGAAGGQRSPSPAAGAPLSASASPAGDGAGAPGQPPAAAGSSQRRAPAGGGGGSTSACISYDRYLRIAARGAGCDALWSPC